MAGQLLKLVMLLCLLATCSRANEDVHIAFLTDCSTYSDWQAVGMAFSYKMTQQPGAITRIMCCKDEERQRYSPQLLGILPTHVAKSYAYNQRIDDNYAAYNKPGAVLDWLQHVTPDEHWVLVVDSDMLLLKQFHPKEFSVTPGWAASADYTYLIGVTNDLWKGHIPEIGPRNDTLAGPYGRHADQVGGWLFAHRDDLKRVAPLWLSITEDVRVDPRAWELSGDQYVEKGGRPWISEMYGYVYAAAKVNLWHRWYPLIMHYPDNLPRGVPKLMHYGLLFEVAGYKFDKHWHYDFDVTRCPPWDLSNPQRATAGIFPPPPRPSTLNSKNNPVQYYRDLLSIETVATLNAAFCDFHLRHCSPHQQIVDICTDVMSLYSEVQDAIQEVEKNYKCRDWHDKCPEWQKAGECERNPEYMREKCSKSCGHCSSIVENLIRPQPTETMDMLAKMKAELAAMANAVSTTATDASHSSNGAADPDTSAKQAAQPKTETPTTTTTETFTTSPAVVMASPSPVQSPAQTTTQEAPRTQLRGHNEVERKDLLIKCYRMALSATEVKECVAAARRGEAYTAKSAVAGGSKDEQAAARRLATDDLPVGDHDSEDLLLKEEDVAAPKGVRARARAAVSGLSTAQAVMLWAVVLAVVLFAGPRMLRQLRRRQLSGRRRE